jgi:hypothetical protein
MVALKITVSAAMRARDVSRPGEDELAEAAEREAEAVRLEAVRLEAGRLEAVPPATQSSSAGSGASAGPGASTAPGGSRRQRRRNAAS